MSARDDRRYATPQATYIGGATLLLEIGGTRFLTDPTLDPGGTAYPTPIYTLRKTHDPARTLESIGPVDAVLLSHDHHVDNLDRDGRALLARVPTILTTPAAADRLGVPATGLAPWARTSVITADGRTVTITATPARHGPADGDRGPVTGFVLTTGDATDHALYISGDTVWFDGVAEVARRFSVTTAVLFLGAARVREVGPAHLTFTAAEAVEAARAFPDARIVPLHFEGWAHFSEGWREISDAFADAGVGDRLQWLVPGTPTPLAPV